MPMLHILYPSAMLSENPDIVFAPHDHSHILGKDNPTRQSELQKDAAYVHKYPAYQIQDNCC